MAAMNARRVQWVAIVTIPLLILLLLIIIRPGPQPSRPECPIDAIHVELEDGRSPQTFKALTIAGDQSTVPEFNDCQRFPVPGNLTTYGPLIGVFASNKLVKEMERMQDLAAQNAAVRAVSMAEIVDWGKGDYTPLNITRAGFGFNCLYMWKENAPDTTLTAAIINVPLESDCTTDRDPTRFPQDARLEVSQFRHPANYPISEYAPVARWDWDPQRHEQYIGIACLDRWCEVARAGHASSREYSGTLSKQLDIKGYYDEEFLAEVTPTGLVVSSVVGTIIPASNLTELNKLESNYEPPPGRPAPWPVVAYTSLDAKLKSYERKLNFTEGGVLTRQFNSIALCKGDRTVCGIPPGVKIKDCHSNTLDPADKWWALVVSAAGNREFRCVIRRRHIGMVIPDIVRWRWSDTDQIGWIKCPDGCCELTGEP